jgi:hypothetical protein
MPTPPYQSGDQQPSRLTANEAAERRRGRGVGDPLWERWQPPEQAAKTSAFGGDSAPSSRGSTGSDTKAKTSARGGTQPVPKRPDPDNVLPSFMRGDVEPNPGSAPTYNRYSVHVWSDNASATPGGQPSNPFGKILKKMMSSDGLRASGGSSATTRSNQTDMKGKKARKR